MIAALKLGEAQLVLNVPWARVTRTLGDHSTAIPRLKRERAADITLMRPVFGQGQRTLPWSQLLQPGYCKLLP